VDPLDRSTLIVDAPGAIAPGEADHDEAWSLPRWTAFRERWSQLTFFLFDPNSWR
jgi:hypothetical protein